MIKGVILQGRRKQINQFKLAVSDSHSTYQGIFLASYYPASATHWIHLWNLGKIPYLNLVQLTNTHKSLSETASIENTGCDTETQIMPQYFSRNILNWILFHEIENICSII